MSERRSLHGQGKFSVEYEEMPAVYDPLKAMAFRIADHR